MTMKAQDVALDRILVDRFRQGDQSAFEQMVSRYWGRIYAMVHQLLRNPEDAEEVTQDTFIRAHRGLVNSAASRRFQPGSTRSPRISRAIAIGTGGGAAGTRPFRSTSRSAATMRPPWPR